MSIFFRIFQPKSSTCQFRLLSIFLFCSNCWSFFSSICNNSTEICLVMRWRVKKILFVSLTSCLIFHLQSGGSRTIQEKCHWLPKIYQQPQIRFFILLYQIFLFFDYRLGHSISFRVQHSTVRLLQKSQFFVWLMGLLFVHFEVHFRPIHPFTNFLRFFFLFWGSILFEWFFVLNCEYLQFSLILFLISFVAFYF